MPFYRITGKINTIDGKIRTVNRSFYDEGEGGIANNALKELAKRKDKGSPWYGDAVHVVKDTGNDPFNWRLYDAKDYVIVDVPYPPFE